MFFLLPAAMVWAALNLPPSRLELRTETTTMDLHGPVHTMRHTIIPEYRHEYGAWRPAAEVPAGEYFFNRQGWLIEGGSTLDRAQAALAGTRRVYDISGMLTIDETFTPGGRLKRRQRPAAGTNTIHFYTNAREQLRYEIVTDHSAVICHIISQNSLVESLYFTNSLLMRHEWPQAGIHAVYAYDSRDRTIKVERYQQQNLAGKMDISYLQGLYTNEITYYSSPGMFDKKTVFEYDGDINLTRKTEYSAANQILSDLTIQYSNSLPLEKRFYAANAVLTNHILYTYQPDSTNLEAKSISNAAFFEQYRYTDNHISRTRDVRPGNRREVYHYTPDFLLTLAKTVDSEGVPEWQTNYAYNSMHDVRAITIYNRENLISDTVFRYVYDHHSNWTNKVEYQRSITYGKARLTPRRGEIRYITYFDLEPYR